MKARVLLVLIPVLSCFLTFPALAETVVEAWRSPFGNASSISANPTDGSVWIAAGSSILHVGPSGVILSQANGYWFPWSVSVNSTDGSCWVADARNFQVVHLSASGEELWRGGGFSVPYSVSVNPTDGSCWVATTTHVIHLSASGEELWRSGGLSLLGYPASVSVNPIDGSCWVATSGYPTDVTWTNGTVVHLSASGLELWRGGGFGNPTSISVNHTDGSCWVADSKYYSGTSYVYGTTVHLSASGTELWRGSGFFDPTSIAVNPVDGSCWVVDRGDYLVSDPRWLHFSASGTELWQGGGVDAPSSVSVNPTDGSCWVGAGLEVVHLSASGEQLWQDEGHGYTSVSANPTDGSCWAVADDQAVHLTASGVELWRNGGFGVSWYTQVNSIAVNPTDGSCWVADAHSSQVVHLSETGTELWRDSGFSNPWSVSVNPTDSSCWVGDAYSNQVVHLSASGTELWRGDGFNHPWSVSVNSADGSCWVGNYTQIVHLSADGQELWRGGGFANPWSVSVNPTDGSCWVADSDNNQVVHLSAAGVELWRGNGFGGPRSVSVNPKDGSCWIADTWSDQVVHLSASGAELWRGGGFRNLQSISVNPADGSVWVADRGNGQVVHLVITDASTTDPGGPTIPPDPPEGKERYYLTGQLHVHRVSDISWASEDMSMRDLETAYANLSYEFIAPTEHHFNLPFGDGPGELFEDPALGQIVHLGDSVEDTADDSHITAAAFEHASLNQSLLGQSGKRKERLRNIQNAGGLAFVAHPNVRGVDSTLWYDYRWSERELADAFGLYTGMEVFTSGVRIVPFPGTIAPGAYSAEDKWTNLLKRGLAVHATATDDYSPPWGAGADGGCVTAVLDLTPTEFSDRMTLKTKIEEALRYGRFYASHVHPGEFSDPFGGVDFTWGAAYAPQIQAWWWDAESSRARIRVYSPAGLRGVHFYTNRRPDHGEEVSWAAVSGMSNTWEASITCSHEDKWVRAEVQDYGLRTSLTQPIWLDRREGKAVEWPPLGAGVRAATSEVVTLDLAGAHLEVSVPQIGISTLTGDLVSVPSRPTACPPLGYIGYCYQFGPDITLAGTNTLTISYSQSDAGLCPESSLAIYWYDEVAGAWVPVSSVVDADANIVTAQVSHLGVFALSGDVGEDLLAPTLIISQPTSGALISGVIEVAADASDDNGVSTARFFLDDIDLGFDTVGADGWTQTLDCSQYAGGDHTLTVLARDFAGNETEASIPVAINSLVPAPDISISAPAEAQILWNRVDASGGWNGSLPMVSGLLYVGDSPLVALTPETPSGSAWVADGDVDIDLDGEYALIAEGVDEVGNRASTAVTVVFRRFADVPRGFWARLDILAAARSGTVAGYDDGTYHPEISVTRDQMAVYISRALAGGDAHVPTGPATATFDDVPVDHWAFKYVEYAQANNIVQGYDLHTYGPAIELDRAQMAVFIARAVADPADRPDLPSYTPPASPTFPDVPTDFWAYKHIEYVADPARAIVHGYNDGNYHPEYVCTRDQMAVFVARAFGLGM